MDKETLRKRLGKKSRLPGKNIVDKEGIRGMDFRESSFTGKDEPGKDPGSECPKKKTIPFDIKIHEENFDKKAVPMLEIMYDLPINQDDCVFIDTETTGLSGGAGTFAFLYGLGVWEDDCFKIHQFFLKNYSCEADFLDYFFEFIKGKKNLISYNGKSFDLPLIKSRAVLKHRNQLVEKLESMIHLDLYHCTRALLKNKMENYKLKTIEKKIILFDRGEDIASELIPIIYLDYLKSGIMNKNMQLILDHNIHDIASLYRILVYLEVLLSKDKDYLNKEGLFTHLINRKNYGSILKLNQFLDKENRDPVSLYYSVLSLKKSKQFENISILFEGSITKENLDYYPLFIEYMKYLEHYKKDYEKALGLMEEKKVKLELILRKYNNKDAKYDFYKRMMRIRYKKNKTGKKNENTQ